MSDNGPLGYILAQHQRAMGVTKAVAPEQRSYRDWSCHFDPKPIPHRGFDWTATSPDFDADCDQYGFFICSGAQANAATFPELCAEIDALIEEMEDDQ